MESKFLNAKELSFRWRIAPETLKQWRWKNKGPKYSKMSGRATYQIKDIEAFEKNTEEIIDEEETKQTDSKKVVDV